MLQSQHDLHNYLTEFRGRGRPLTREQVCQNIADTAGQVLKVDLAVLRSSQLEEQPEQYFIYQKSTFDNLSELESLKSNLKLKQDELELELIQYQSKHNPPQKSCSTLSVPLLCQQELVGILKLYSGDRDWQPEEIQLVEMMATQWALAINQVLAYEQMQALAQREEMINRITATIRSSLEPQTIFTAITTELGQALEVDGCTLSLWTKEDKFVQCVGLYNPRELTLNRQQNLPKSVVPIAENPVLQKLLITKKPVVLADLEQHPEIARYDLPWHSFTKALLIVPLMVDEQIIGSITLRQSCHSRPWNKSNLALAEAVASQAAIAVQQARLYETTRLQAELLQQREKKVQELNNYLTESVLKRFLPAAIVNQAAAGKLWLDLTPEPRHVTVLFCDLVGFTALSSQLGTRRLAELLNEYLEAMTKAVFEQRGTVDKFIGDGIMALFGAPEQLSPRQQAQKAIATAQAMHHYLKELDRKWQLQELLIKEHFPPLQLRCGIHQGKAVVGMFGGQQRKDYTAIGTVVNLAFRLQEVAEADSILVSATVAAHLEQPTITQTQSFKLKGMESEVLAYSIQV